MAVIRNPKTGQESNLIGLSPADRNKFLGITPSAGETALLSKAKQRLQAASGVTGGGSPPPSNKQRLQAASALKKKAGAKLKPAPSGAAGVSPMGVAKPTAPLSTNVARGKAAPQTGSSYQSAAKNRLADIIGRGYHIND